MKKGLKILAALLIAAVSLAGCAKKDAGSDDKAIKIAMVTDVGGVNDQSFNQSAWEGLQKAEKELGVSVSYLESNQDADYKPNMETLYDGGNDLIWGIGFKMGDALKEAGISNPEQQYAIIDFAYGDDTPANVLGVQFKEHESSFLVGYIAGKMTKTNKVGFVGGIEGFVIGKFDAGFEAGVKYANPEAEVLRQYAESFTDAAKGKSIATQMFQQGADIVYHAAGGVGDGVIEAAKEQDKWAIGVDRDQNYLAPDNVLTSAMKNVGNVMFTIAEEMKAGTYVGGKTMEFGLAEGGVEIAPTSSKHVPADILAEVEEVKAKIIAGEISVPMQPE